MVESSDVEPDCKDDERDQETIVNMFNSLRGNNKCLSVVPCHLWTLSPFGLKVLSPSICSVYLRVDTPG